MGTASQKALTNVMRQAVDFMKSNGGRIHRHPGGYWTGEKFTSYQTTFGTSTVNGIVDRGVAQWTEWKVGRSGRFPITAELVEQAGKS